MYQMFFGDYEGFNPFTWEHFIPVFIMLLASIFWIQKAKSWNEEKQFTSVFIFSLILAGLVLFWMLVRMLQGKFNISEDLPFHLCNILALLMPIALSLKKRWFFGLLYFWLLVGTLNAILTPELKEDFPHYTYFRYWIVHCGLISILFYGLVIFKWKIYTKDIWYAIIGANVYLVFSIIVNLISGGNYFYSMRKPDAATLLDYLGDWPWYLFTGQFVMIIFFLIIFIPILIFQKKTRTPES